MITQVAVVKEQGEERRWLGKESKTEMEKMKEIEKIRSKVKREVYHFFMVWVRSLQSN